jgi:hypothetical protein
LFLCIVDPIVGRLYWTDRSYIKSSKLNGTDEQVIIILSNFNISPWAIVSHGSFIYFSDPSLEEIFRLNKTPGSSPVPMYDEITDYIPRLDLYGFVLYSMRGKLFTLVYRMPNFIREEYLQS